MNAYIITLIGILILAPLLYLLPTTLTSKGKWILLSASLLIAETALLTMTIFPYWQAIIMMILLVAVTSYLLQNRVSNLVVECGEMERNQKAIVDLTHSVNDPIGNVESINYASTEGNFEKENPAVSHEVDFHGKILEEANDPNFDYGVIEDLNYDYIESESLEHGELVSQIDGILEDSAHDPLDDELIQNDRLEDLQNSVHQQQQKETLQVDIEPLSIENSYLAEIEKMLEEGELNLTETPEIHSTEEAIRPDVFPEDSEPEEADSLASSIQLMETMEFQSFSDDIESAEHDDSLPLAGPSAGNLIEVSNSETTYVKTDKDSQVKETYVKPASENMKEFNAQDLEVMYENVIEKQESEIKEVVSQSPEWKKELDDLIVNSLKFAKYQMAQDSYTALLESQLVKELPDNLKYEISIMLINDYYRVGKYEESFGLIQKLQSVFGHLPAVSLELDTIKEAIKRLMKQPDNKRNNNSK